MEELFQLILVLFILSFPFLSILSRRRQAGRTRRAEAGDPETGRGWRRRQGREAADAGANAGAGAGAGAGEPAARAATADKGSRQAADLTMASEIGRRGPGAVSAGRPRRPQAAALERIAARSRLQQAVIWAEVLGRPRALRGAADPRDHEGSL
ncbi:MAG: hypothetical protein ACLFNX_08710 [Spirochaetaceae bacterium]